MLNLSCIICAQLIAPSNVVYIIHCGHMFHERCLKQWIPYSETCPQCRRKCTQHNIFRVYFNLANLNESRMDFGAMQEQIDNSKLQIQLKESQLKDSKAELNLLKEKEKREKLENAIQRLKLTTIVNKAFKEQVALLNINRNLENKIKSLEEHIETLGKTSALIKASGADVEKIVKKVNNPTKLATWIIALKREVKKRDHKNSLLLDMIKQAQTRILNEKILRKTQEERMTQLVSENDQLKEKIKSASVGQCSSTQDLITIKMSSQKRGLKSGTNSPRLEQINTNAESTNSESTNNFEQTAPGQRVNTRYNLRVRKVYK
ncbi:E3 ubiquitin-protein ligase TRAIP-like [Teleopsis dalmanni]|uniref:E3 ubiquitin-protein ligase TRAIP-like n=1 Tax=Teleopsis dalmanni TaxID=139649 RepID=UPI0018CEA396|nr:E3 ubiquitin-protein ligase TRAIP-like [Teleopsis dalmanni]